MSTTTSTTPTPAAAKPASIVATVDANAANLVSREMTFFETHPKAIAIGAGVAGLIVGFVIGNPGILAHIF